MDKKELLKILIVLIIIGVAIYTIINYKNEIEEYDYSEQNLNEILEINKENIVEIEKEEEIKVYITGEVNNPGVKILKDGERIEDLINLAGGLTLNADIGGVNFAYRLEDGMKIYIPNINDKITNEIITIENSEGIVKSMENKGTTKINLNKADLLELCELPGVGEALAKKIIDYREENGKFKNVEDLKKVSGVGDKKYENLKEYIVVK